MVNLLQSFSTKRNLRIKTRRAYPTKWLLMAVFFLGAVFLIVYVGRRAGMMLKAASILYALSPTPTPRSVRVYLRIFGNRVDIQDVEIPGKNGPIPAHIYAPRNRPDAPILVLIHGMSPEGFNDPGITRLGNSMAAVGLKVITPDIRSERQLRVRFDGVSDIDEAVRWAYGRKNRPVSLMGVSFSGGLVVAAAAQPKYAQYVRMVFSVSGYDDLYRLCRYYLGHGDYGPDNRVAEVRPPPSGPLSMAIQHMDEMVPADDQSAIEQAVMDYQLRLPLREKEDLRHLSPAQQKLFIDLKTLDTPAIRKKYELLLERHKRDLARISPHNDLSALKASLFILHGETDRIIPVSEAKWLAHDAPENIPVHLLIDPWMQHVSLNAYPPRSQKLKLARFLAQVLYAAGLH